MHVSRREFLGAAIGGLASALLPRCLSAAADDRDAKLDGLLIEMERRICLFFYEQVDPVTGLVKDRARHTGADAHTISSIAATGFGLSAMCIAHANSFLKPADTLQRVQQTLEFLASRNRRISLPAFPRPFRERKQPTSEESHPALQTRKLAP